VHAVTDERVARRGDFNTVAMGLARGGGPDLAFHARGHTLSGREHFELARTLGGHAPSTLFVSDRLDIALATGAVGVQLSWTRWSPVDARRVQGMWWIGCSVHDRNEAEAARTGGADYLLLGPMFPTPTHPGREPLGLAAVRGIVRLGLPVIAIGGIEPRHVRALAAEGVSGVAAIRGFWDAADPAEAARSFVEAWR